MRFPKTQYRPEPADDGSDLRLDVGLPFYSGKNGLEMSDGFSPRLGLIMKRNQTSVDDKSEVADQGKEKMPASETGGMPRVQVVLICRRLGLEMPKSETLFRKMFLMM
jgi:hypothetical protein